MLFGTRQPRFLRRRLRLDAGVRAVNEGARFPRAFTTNKMWLG